MRIPRRASSLLAAAIVVGTSTASMGSPAPRPASEPAFAGPVVQRVGCPTSTGLGVASHPGPAVAVARRFLLAQRALARSHGDDGRLVRAIWWIQVVLPRCDCDPDRVLDLLVVRRNGRYGVSASPDGSVIDQLV